MTKDFIISGSFGKSLNKQYKTMIFLTARILGTGLVKNQTGFFRSEPYFRSIPIYSDAKKSIKDKFTYETIFSYLFHTHVQNLLKFKSTDL